VAIIKAPHLLPEARHVLMLLVLLGELGHALKASKLLLLVLVLWGRHRRGVPVLRLLDTTP
jgi:hypothetical protein